MLETCGSVVQFGDFEVDFKAGELRKHGVPVSIQHQPYRVLQALVDAGGAIISRDELQHLLWGREGTCGSMSLNVAVHKLRVALGDSAASPTFIETVGSLGYRFLRDGPRRQILDLPPAVHRIAVLPLRVNGSAELQNFADAVLEDLMSSLTRAGVHVIIPSPGFIPRDRRGERSVQLICRELRVRSVLMGTIRHLDGHVRVNVKLIDGGSLACTWVESCARTVTSFSAETQIARCLARLLLQHLSSRECDQIPA